LAHAEEILTWRAAVQRWRRNTILLGNSDDAALAAKDLGSAELSPPSDRKMLGYLREHEKAQ